MNDELCDFQRTITESKQHVDDVREQDIEARRCNVVLYRVPESSAILNEDRRKEDITFCQQFFDAFNVGFAPDDMKNMCTVWVQDKQVKMGALDQGPF